jgi:uncharacterized protein (TIGR02391 family)
MAISNKLHSAILAKLNITQPTLSRRSQALIRKHGPMSPDEARWVIGHNAGLDLKKFGLSNDQLDRVRELRAATVGGGVVVAPKKQAAARSAPQTLLQSPAVAPTRSALFSFRQPHPAVEKAARKLFVDGHSTDAIRKAFVSVANRVKRMSGSKEDGQKLMGSVFGGDAPAIQFSELVRASQKDEQQGIMFLMMGGIAALRNPRSHEDSWEPDSDVGFVLDALSLASLLHRFLDRCERATE